MRSRKQQRGKQQQEKRPLQEDRPDPFIFLCTVSPGYQHLRTDTETEAEHINHEIIDSRQCRRSQLDFPHPPQVGRIGQPDHVLHQETHQNGECYL